MERGKQKLLNDSHLSDRFEIENASIEITLPDQLTIKIPYALADKYVDDKKLPDKEIDFISSEMNKVSTELINLLKKDPVFPIRTFNLPISIKKLSEK